MSASRLATVGALLLGVTACQPRNVSFVLAFEEPTTRDDTTVIVVRIRSGSCTGAVLYAEAFTLSDPLSARAPQVLPRGTYAFEAEARGNDCTVVARECVTLDLPLEGDELRLTLADVTEPAACPPEQCMAGECMGDEPDAGPPPRDAGRDEDAGMTGCSSSTECPGGECRDEACCYGCWDGTTCQGGASGGACGTAGGACEVCGVDTTCIGASCVAGAPVTLSLSAVTSYVRAGGRLWSAGVNTGSQRGELDSGTANVFARQSSSIAFVDVAAAQLASCGIDTAGAMYCWGSNSPGLLGIGMAGSLVQPVPQVVTGTWRDVDAGNEHFCAIRSDDHLFCWGSSGDGRLGVTGTSRNAPTEVEGAGTWSSVSAGSLHTCAIRSDGALFCWGNADNGQLGVAAAVGGSTPQRVGSATDWRVVSAGVEHTCGLRADELFCWGTRDFGRLGNGPGTGPQETPILIDGSRAYVTVAAGQFHSCAVTDTDELYCWGTSPFGQTGLGVPGDVDVPTLVLSGVNIVDTGWTHTCAADADDATLTSLRCWGDGRNGLLGSGATANVTMPITPMLVPAP